MIEDKLLTVGTRVRLPGDSHVLRLSSDTGEVVARHEVPGYYVVRLDEPARVLSESDTWRETREVIEAADNLTLIESAR